MCLASVGHTEEARSSLDRSLKPKEESSTENAISIKPSEDSQPLDIHSDILTGDTAADNSQTRPIPLVGLTEDSVETKAEAIAQALQDALTQVDVSRDSLEQMNYNQLLQYVQQLRDALVLANAEAEFFRQQWQQLRLANEAMGIDILTGDDQALQQRLVQAVRELYNTERERREAIKTLQELLDSSLNLVRSGSGYNPQLRAQYEEAHRSARKLIEGKGNAPIPIAQSLADAQIVNINDDLKTIVINAGSSHGVKVGMPFRVLRNNIVIGSVKILQTRETISAAVIEQVQGGQVLKVKDRVSLATNLNKEKNKTNR